MKATIHGITIEGTPQEIAEYTKLKHQVAAVSSNPYWNWMPRTQEEMEMHNKYMKMYNDACAEWNKNITMWN